MDMAKSLNFPNKIMKMLCKYEAEEMEKKQNQ